MTVSTRDRYSMPQIVIHWLVVLLVIFNWISGDGMGEAFRDRVRNGAPATLTPHVIAGVLIVLLLLGRLLLRRTHGTPAPVPGAPWMMTAAKIGHAALYLLMVLVPLSGMIAWFGANRSAGEAHELLFNLLLAVAGLHALAALYHQFILKDGTLNRMSPHG